MKAYGWYQKLHDENSPEYKAAIEELIREKEIFMKSKFIGVNTISGPMYIASDRIESIHVVEDDECPPTQCVITMRSGNQIWVIESAVKLLEMINTVQDR